MSQDIVDIRYGASAARAPLDQQFRPDQRKRTRPDLLHPAAQERPRLDLSPDFRDLKQILLFGQQLFLVRHAQALDQQRAIQQRHLHTLDFHILALQGLLHLQDDPGLPPGVVEPEVPQQDHHERQDRGATGCIDRPAHPAAAPQRAPRHAVRLHLHMQRTDGDRLTVLKCLRPPHRQAIHQETGFFGGRPDQEPLAFHLQIGMDRQDPFTLNANRASRIAAHPALAIRDREITLCTRKDKSRHGSFGLYPNHGAGDSPATHLDSKDDQHARSS